MGSAVEQLEHFDTILTVECREPEGTVVRRVNRCALSFQTLRGLWHRLREFDVIFNMSHGRDFGKFVQNFIVQGEDGELHPTGLFWLVDDVGILYLTDIVPGYDATAHFVFWDRRFRGREELIREMVRYVFDLLKLHRITVETPLHPPLLGFIKRIGFVEEGHKRSSLFINGQWRDSIIFSLIEGEI